jgi:hypothetical protein
MTSIFEDIKSFFTGPSIEKCTKEEKKENDKHDAKVDEENERHKTALQKIKETANCKLKPDTKKDLIEPKPSSSLFNDNQEPEKILERPKTPEPSYFDKQEQPPLERPIQELPRPPIQERQIERPPQPNQLGGKKRTRRARKNKRKNTKRSH